VVSSFKLSSGETLWQTKYPAPYKMSSAAINHGKGPKSTPVIHQGKLVTLGISGILSCFDLESGKSLWSHNFSGVFEKTSPLYGTAMSPIVVGDRVIAHVGGDDHGALRAYSLDSGKLIWSWDEDGPGYASPVLANLEGVEQIVTQSQEKIIGISLKDGNGLWQIPFSTPYTQNIVTPIKFGDLLIFSGLQNGTFAIQLKEENGRWSTQEVWKNSTVSSYMSSPVLEGGLMFGFSHYKKGQLFCLDAKKGENLWIGPGRQGESAALILSDQFLFVLDTDAEFQVYENSGEGLKPVAEHTIADSPTWAHPVVLGSRVLIKDVSNLTLWDFPAQ
jgi:outer membrane protein assembly factor BamB